ncbi:nucleoside phosphorylase [Candidatus Desantisbacteria bacterium]|nr:nucleoside phosphorylase [Candidatus Desantisbacteria bacterium]
MTEHTKPHHLKCQSVDIAPYALLSGDPGRTKMVAEKYLENARLINDFRGLVAYTGEYEGISVSVVTTGMGCPSADIVLEEMKMLGVKTVIRIGTCGAIQKDIPPGRIIIPSGAVPLCGILKVYDLELLPPVPDYTVLRAIVDSAVALKKEYNVGIIATSDAFYREIPQAREWENKNVLAFEMECAGLFSLGIVRGIRVGAVLTATGNILYGKQVMETEEIALAIEDEIQIALNTVKRLEEGL